MKATTFIFSILTAAGPLVEARHVDNHIHLLNRQEATTPTPTWTTYYSSKTSCTEPPAGFPTTTVSVNPGDYFHSPNKRGEDGQVRARHWGDGHHHHHHHGPTGTGWPRPTGTGTGTGYPRPTGDSGSGWVGWQRVRTKVSEPFVPRAAMPFAGA